MAYAIGAAIVLSGQDEVHLPDGPKRPALYVVADQHDEDEPTFCLYSQLAQASSRSGHRGMDLTLARREAELLRNELARWLATTA